MICRRNRYQINSSDRVRRWTDCGRCILTTYRFDPSSHEALAAAVKATPSGTTTGFVGTLRGQTVPAKFRRAWAFPLHRHDIAYRTWMFAELWRWHEHKPTTAVYTDPMLGADLAKITADGASRLVKNAALHGGLVIALPVYGDTTPGDRFALWNGTPLLPGRVLVADIGGPKGLVLQFSTPPGWQLPTAPLPR
jgi:hypothetical protein